MDITSFTQRDKAVLTGIYLSKFGDKALREFGFSSYKQAYNVLGYALKTKPTSIKLYRDEFDSVFPNRRHGWNREPRGYCMEVLAKANDADFDEFSDLIRAATAKEPASIVPHSETSRRTFSARRLITGEAAEEYFKMNYASIEAFKGYTLHDTTRMGCGFDFKLTLASQFYCIEVKGLDILNGNVMMTEREYETAQETGARYCLFVVRNFHEKPEHIMFFNPTSDCRLHFTKHKRITTEVSYTTDIK